jgi:hypothetical protein
MNPELVKFHLPTTDQFSVALTKCTYAQGARSPPKAHLFALSGPNVIWFGFGAQSRYCEYICGATIWPRPDVPTALALDWWGNRRVTRSSTSPVYENEQASGLWLTFPVTADKCTTDQKRPG